MNADFSNVQFNHGKKTIVSIYPIASAAWRDRGPGVEGGRTHYVLAPAEKGSFVKLDVYDSFERTYDPMKTEPGRPGFSPYPISAAETVNDLMQQWVFSRIGGASGFRPGIMVIDGDEPTTEELATLEAMQRGYAEFMIHDAEQAAEKHEWKKITDVHRAMARWTGHKAVWVADVGAKTLKDCVACYSAIDIRASVCKVCRERQPALESTPVEVIATPVAVPVAAKKPLPPPVKVSA